MFAQQAFAVADINPGGFGFVKISVDAFVIGA